MERYPRLACLVACLSLLTPRNSRAEAPIQDFQTWTQLQTTLDLSRLYEGLYLNLESTVRRGSPASLDKTHGDLQDDALTYLFLRPSLQLEVHEGVVVALGYAYAPVFYDAVALRKDENVKEHRVWEQLTLSHAFGRANLASRTRFEQRMRSEGPGEGDTEVRLRQRFRLSVKLTERLPWHVVTSDEPMFFLNHTRFSSQSGFSENRVFVGLGYKVEAVNIEFGYLNQFVGGPSSSTHRVNHVLSTSVTFVFNGDEAGPGA